MFINIVQTIFFLIASPRKGWKRIIDKKINHQDFINNFLFPVFGFVAITTFVGGMWFAESTDIRWALKLTVAAVSALFGGFYLASYALNELFPKFGADKNLNIAQQFVGYSSVVVYLLFLVMPLLSGLAPLWFLVIYTLYVVYAGAGEFLRVERNKRLGVAVVASLLIVVAPLLIKFLLNVLIKLTV
ncbi:MAG: YIP1 family protein [Bacteroidia bacterium]|nr:YIP1 family protein [Bacteroidia bacterium]